MSPPPANITKQSRMYNIHQAGKQRLKLSKRTENEAAICIIIRPILVKRGLTGKWGLLAFDGKTHLPLSWR